jgi:hypothetical protein
MSYIPANYSTWLNNSVLNVSLIPGSESLDSTINENEILIQLDFANPLSISNAGVNLIIFIIYS